MKPLTKLVLAPHPDDEILGLGGAMARWAREGHAVHVVVATSGYPPIYSPEEEQACRAETRLAHARLGVASACFLDLPAAELDTLMHRELNEKVRAAVLALAPDELYIPFLGDVHRDHQLVFQSALVAARPCQAGFPRRLYAYESLEDKLEAFALVRSQVKPPPHERSLEALRALAVLRGATVGLGAAEALVTIRTVA